MILAGSMQHAVIPLRVICRTNCNQAEPRRTPAEFTDLLYRVKVIWQDRLLEIIGAFVECERLHMLERTLRSDEMLRTLPPNVCLLPTAYPKPVRMMTSAEAAERYYIKTGLRSQAWNHALPACLIPSASSCLVDSDSNPTSNAFLNE